MDDGFQSNHRDEWKAYKYKADNTSCLQKAKRRGKSWIRSAIKNPERKPVGISYQQKCSFQYWLSIWKLIEHIYDK